MFKNYVKTAFRNLLKNKGFTTINVLGLALGLATCLLIVLYVIDELSYDRYNLKADRIYRVNDDIKFNHNAVSSAASAAPLAATLVSTFPEVEKAVRFDTYGTPSSVKKGTQNIDEKNITYCDPTVFDIFTLPMINGDPARALIEPNSVVITERTAKKYFNSTNVIGKTLLFDNINNYKITGVIKDIPEQSHFKFDFFISMATFPASKETTWLNTSYQTYVLLKPGADYKKLEGKLSKIVSTYIATELRNVVHAKFDRFERSGNYFRLNLIPIKDIHLQSNRQDELGPNGNAEYVYIFSAVAVFILLVACINFMNLSTARSSSRAREVGVRKVLGSPRKYLVAQFLTESIMVALVAVVIALFADRALLPLFNQVSGKNIVVSNQLLAWLLPVSFILVFVIGALAGTYPAFFLSGFQPVDVLKGKIAKGFNGGGLRNFLVVFQFSISIFLIVGTLVIYNQLKYIQNKDLGYNRDHVLVVKNVSVLGDHAKGFKQEIKQLPGVINATLSGFTPTSGYENGGTMFKSPTLDSKSGILIQQWSADEDYIRTLGMKLVSGRDFSSQMATDSKAIIINETAARILGFADPLNQQLYRASDNAGKIIRSHRIIGVIKDFNFNSLRQNITPLVIVYQDDNSALNIRVNSANVSRALANIKAVWDKFSPNQQFNYSFMDQDFDAIYRSEQRMGTIFISFTMLAIIIACLGLFGLAAYAAEQRTKEIGIRKVLGADVSTIVNLLSRDFMKLVFLAIVISSPFAWWAMHSWLQDFAYHQDIKWWLFIIAGGAAILIAFITISFQSIKAALVNPVKSLRSE
jgi:putative ABC transport system permease protein